MVFNNFIKLIIIVPALISFSSVAQIQKENYQSAEDIFEIPEGYELSGLEKLKINESYPIDKPTIRFSSVYSVEGDMVTITVVEHYDEVFFEKKEIDDFRRIINAAANFNKIVLFLVKK